MADDDFGSEVARRLAQWVWPAGVRVVDFGIRGIDLVYALMDGYDLTILIDATPQGGQPGTLYTIEPDLSELRDADASQSALDGHTMDPLKVLRTVCAMGGSCQNILLVGCEPADLGGVEGRMGLSKPVAAAVDEACNMVESLVEEFLASQHKLTVTVTNERH
jgi:hydrogenase maturation protease